MSKLTVTTRLAGDHGDAQTSRRRHGGDCIDCGACVTLPHRIDIRDGIQLECISCGLCVDACNHVMERIGRPRGWSPGTRWPTRPRKPW